MTSPPRASLRLTGIVVLVLGALMAALGGSMLASGHSPAMLAAGLLAAGGGAVALLRARTAVPPAAGAPVPSAPLAARRQRWLMVAAGWLGALAAGSAIVWGLGPATPAIPKLLLFLGLPTGALLAGRRWLERQNGSADWPT
jgi:ABC-type xylose transport system permease subunit